MKRALWSCFNIAAVSTLTLLGSELSASALEHRSEQEQAAIDHQSATCSPSEIEALSARWQASYLPAGATLRDCGDRAIASLIDVMNDQSVQLRTRYLSARLIGQIGSPSAIHSLFSALGNNLPEEDSRIQLQSMGLKGIEALLEKEDQPFEDRFSHTVLPEVLQSPDLSSDIRLGAMIFSQQYVMQQTPSAASNFFAPTNRTLTAIAADEREASTIRLSALNTLSELIYRVSGDFLVEASSLEQLVKIAESNSDAAIRQGAVNALMMTYYMTATDSSCEWRWQEMAIAHQAVSDLASRPHIDSLWDLGPTELSRLARLRANKAAALKNRVALNNLVDLPHPAGQDICDNLVEDGIAPGDFFIQSIESNNQPRLYALLVAWARSL